MNEDELADLLDEGAGPRARWGGRNDAQTRAAAAHVRALMGDEAVWAEPDAEGADALLASIRHEQAELDDLANGRGERRWVPRPARRPAPFAPTRAEADRSATGPWATVARTGERLERRFGATRVRLGIAAAIVAVLGLGVLAGAALGGGAGDGDGEAAGADAPPAWDAAGATEFDLAGTDRAPDASAVAAWDDTPSGVEMWLTCDGLGPAPEGSYYEAAATGPDGRVSLGTFHLRDGDDRVILWSGVPLDEYPTVTVSLRREGADESTAEVVLEGDAST